MSAVLSYRYPPVNPAVKANSELYNKSPSTNGVVFRSDMNQSVLINIASNTQFLKTVQSYLTGTVTPYDVDGNEVKGAAVKNSKQGVSRIFSRISIRFGGVEVESFSNYADLLAMYYNSVPQTKADMLKFTEGFSDDNWHKDGGRKFAHLLMSSLWVTDQALPLPLIQSGGITVELFLAPASDYFISDNVAYYELREPVLNWLGITPSPDYIIGLRQAVASGRSAYIAYQRVHAYPGVLNGSQTNQLILPIGQVSSIASIETVFFAESSLTTRSVDKYSKFTDAKLADMRIEGSGINLPTNTTFKFNGGKDPELALLALISSSGNAYTMDRLTNFSPNAAFKIGLNFESDSEVFGSGLSTIGSASPFVTITTTHTEAQPSTVRWIAFVTTDALIEFRGADIALSEIF